MSVRGISQRIAIISGLLLAAGAAVWMGPARSEVRAAARAARQVDTGNAGKVPVLVELFTAEGCSSCPPADALLGKLDREQPLENVRIIVLSEHVDYWNYGGWHDRFSSAELTERQREYQYIFKLPDVYTPQMIVNGAAQMNGSDGKAVASALEAAAYSHPIPVEITSVQAGEKEVTFTLRNGMPATAKDVNVYAALVDPEDTTEVRGGENRGRTLQHFGVVRVLNRIGGSYRTETLGEKPFVLRESVAGRQGVDGMRLVVFVQGKNLGPVLGADACVIGVAKLDGRAFAACPVKS